MAAIMMKSAVMVKPTAQATRPVASLKPAVRAAPKVVPTSAKKMMVWRPDDNKMFETFSYLPPLTDSQIAKQVDYVVNNGWTPCLEFAMPGSAYVSNENTVRFGATSAGYYDNRYWTMWKLPMFGCSDPSQVLKEVKACTSAFPDSYIRMVAFDSNRQVQIAGFLVHRPSSAKDWRPVDKRQV